MNILKEDKLFGKYPSEGRVSKREKYLSLMPIKDNGEEMSCDELHENLTKEGIILDRVKHTEPMCNSLKIGKNLMFVGPPGTAKTLTAKALSGILRKRDENGKPQIVPFYRISANRDMTASDFFGDWKFHEQMLDAQRCREIGGTDSLSSPGMCKTSTFFDEKYFNWGPALKAVREGGVLLVDEINRAGPDFPNMIFEVAEEKQATIPLLNDDKPIFNQDRRFPLLIGTMNELDTGTTREMSVALARRFAYVFFDTADGPTLQRILDENYGESIKREASQNFDQALKRRK